MGNRLVRTILNSDSSSSGAKSETSAASTVRSKASVRRRFSRRALFLRIWRSMPETQASMDARISEVLSEARRIMLPERTVISQTFRSFSTLKTTDASPSVLK